MTTNTQIYTTHQQRVLALMPLFPGCLSVLGSSLVIAIIRRDWKRKTRHVYHRLLFAYSVLDILLSLNLMFGFLMLPKGTNWGAQGNTSTCSFSGVLFNMQFGSFIYVASLSTYYFLVLGHQVSERTLAKYFEPFCHFLAIPYPALVSIGALRRAFYNPLIYSRGSCWFQDVPLGCADDEEVPCERGGGAESYQRALLGVLTYVGFLAVFITMLGVYITVRRKLRLAAGNMNDFAATMLRDTRSQCFLYVFSYFSIIVWAIIHENVVDVKYSEAPPTNDDEVNYLLFPVSLLLRLLLPAGGVWNALVYIRPRYVTLKRQNPSQQSWRIYWSVIVESQQPIPMLRRGGGDGGEQRGGRGVSEEQSSNLGNSLFQSTIWGTSSGVGSASGTEANSGGRDDFIPEIIYLELSTERVTQISNAEGHSEDDSNHEDELEQQSK